MSVSFDDMYREQFDFVWRSVRRLGIDEANAEDVAQEVFVTVHKKLAQYDPDASAKAWVFGIVRRVVANARRAQARRRVQAAADALDAADPDSGRQPQALAERHEGVRILYAILEELDADKREAFILAELEQLPVPEIARALDTNLNTMYSRLRAARRQFKEAVGRHRAREKRPA